MNSKKKILIIEDEPMFAGPLKMALEKENLSVFLVSDGREGFPSAVKNKPDLILLDLILPWENGFSVLEKLKKSGETKGIPVIILSNLSGSEDHKKCFDLGAEDFLVKTRMSIKEVIDIIKKVIEQRSEVK